jgi:hypothetical protein
VRPAVIFRKTCRFDTALTMVKGPQEPAMAAVTIDRTLATSLMTEERPLTVAELTQLVRYLNRHCEDQDGKIRQLKSEIGRVARVRA